jgi:hypothetical protein
MSDPKKPTALQESAVHFVAALAADVDRQHGITAPNGTPETQAKVIAVVKDRFFKDDAKDEI